jgi:MFS family permease
MIFGSFVGGMADAGGRKKFVLVFAITYIASCVTKHFHSFNILLLGRFLGGIATSLLFSIFDSWLIKSHSNLGLESSYLSQSFAAASYGNYAVAILAGLVANRMADTSEMVEWGTGQTVNEASGILFYGGYLNENNILMDMLV